MERLELKLAEFIKANGIEAEQLVFETSCHSVEDAADSANAAPQDFVKNVCVIDGTKNEEDSERLIVAIVPGETRMDFKKLGKVARSNKLRMANAEEVLEKTGYPAGGTPSFGYSAKFFVDEKVLEKKIVYSGGGSQKSLTRLAPAEIIRVNTATIADLCKE